MMASLECRRRWRRRGALRGLAAIVAIGFAAPGCDIGNNTRTARLDVAIDRTGSLQSDGLYFPMTATKTVSLGDSGSNYGERGIVSVTLGAIPPGANVTQVILRLTREAPFGNPFDDFGTLSVDHVNVVSGIVAASFLGNVITASIATVDPGLANQIVELDVTSHVKADIAAGRPIASFRFQFNAAPSADNAADRVFFSADPDSPALQPHATATFRP
jgi:hypothetical protein